jgi:hypothetical protein
MKIYNNTLMKTILKLALIFLTLGCRTVYSQNAFNYEKVPDDIRSKNAISDDERAKTIAGIPNLYDLTKSLPAGFARDGSADYTEYLQNGINTNQNVIFPDFPVLINSKGLSLKSNTTVVFAKNSKLILSPASASSYQIIRMHNISNTKLYYPNIVGDRNGHMGSTGEWGMGISIRGGSNHEVYNANVSNCWGDGIYLADGVKNVTLYNPYVDNNRRNGISVVSANGVKMYNALASNTNGTQPMAGIDIEPNHNTDVIDNILVQNPITYNNKSQGVLFVLKSLAGPTGKNVNIDIVNHKDIGSNYGMGFYNGSKKQGALPVQGNIHIVNPDWSGSRQSPIFMDKDMDNNQVNLKITHARAGRKSISDLKRISSQAKNVEFGDN